MARALASPPFFSQGPYPASAIVVDDSQVWKIPREEFLKLLKNNFEIHLDLTRVLCDRLVYKSTMLTELAIEEAEHRLTTLIRHLMEHSDRRGKPPPETHLYSPTTRGHDRFAGRNGHSFCEATRTETASGYRPQREDYLEASA